MLAAEHDSVTPQWNAEIVLNGSPDQSKLKYRMVVNAGHFSFLSPFPFSMIKPGFLPSTDPAGFDRVEFYRELSSEILDWFNSKLNLNLDNSRRIAFVRVVSTMCVNVIVSVVKIG